MSSNTAIPGANEFGDFLVDPAAGKFWSFNSGTGVVEYNMRLGASPSLTVVQTDANAVTMQCVHEFRSRNALDSFSFAAAGISGSKNDQINLLDVVKDVLDGYRRASNA